MGHPRSSAITGLLLLSVFSSYCVAATVSSDQAAAQQAILKVLKNPEEVRFGTFTIAGPKGACMTVFKKNWQTMGTHEAFLLRTATGWEALYVADVPSGHQGCIDEMSKR
jgi:hypothetical protein